MKNCTDITMILDRSGSMATCKAQMEEALNGFLTDQKRGGFDCRFSLVRFDTQYEVVYSNVPINSAEYIRIDPRGGTALLDAIAKTINDTGMRLAAMQEWERPNKVLIIIITDGEENSSREFALHQVREMIKHQKEKYSWTFMFLGADQNAFAVANNMAISTGNTLNFAGGVHAGGPRGAKYVGQNLSLSARKMSSGEKITSDTLISDHNKDDDPRKVELEYQQTFGEDGAIK